MEILSKYFTASYGKYKKPFGNLSKGKTPFVSSGDSENGIVDFFDLKPLYKNVITVARTGSVGSSFYHPYECVINSDCIVLEPKNNFTKEQMFMFVFLLRKNIYRYSYARKVTPERILSTIIPEENLDKIEKILIDKILEKVSHPFSPKKLSLTDRQWEWFEYQEIFDIYGGYYNKKPEDEEKGNIPFIGATENNNGITSRHNLEEIKKSSKDGSKRNHDISKKIFKKNCITISNNGSVGNAFYQPIDFTCSHDVNPVYLKNKELNQYIAMFLCTLIGKEKFRWAYGRKWRPMRMPSSKIKLPITTTGEPDWQFMEDFIKGLSYSASI